MGICVVTNEGQRISLGRSIIRTGIKFLPWEVAHFGVWRLILPTHYSEFIIFIILTAVNVTIILYLIVPLTNRKRKTIYDWVADTAVSQS